MAGFPYTIRISSSVISQKVLLGETLLMDTKTLTYFGLDEFGSKVWKELESCGDADVVYARLKKSQVLDEDTLARKFNGILKGLEMSRIITLESSRSD